MTAKKLGKHSNTSGEFFKNSSSNNQTAESLDSVLNSGLDEETADSDLVLPSDNLSDPEDALFSTPLPQQREDIDATGKDELASDDDAEYVADFDDKAESDNFALDGNAGDSEDMFDDENKAISEDFEEDFLLVPVEKGNGLDSGAAEGSAVSPWSRHTKDTEQLEQAAEFELRPKSRKALWITLAIIFGVLLIAYVAASVFFMSHFGFNTSINDVDCSFKTVEEAQSLIKDHVANYELEVIERNNGGELIKGSGIALQYSEDNRVSDYLENRNSFAWPARLFSHEEQGAQRVSVSYDEVALTEAIASLACMKPDAMLAPVNAFAEYDGSEYIIHPESLGTTLDPAAVTTAITSAISDTESSVDLDKAGCYLAPEITSESKELAEKVKLYNTYIPFSITYTFGDTTEVVSGDAVIDWFTISPEGTATLNEDAIGEWVSDFASRHDTVGATRDFLTYEGIPANVSGGSYGWEIDQDAEIAALVEACTDKTSQVREPYYLSTADSHANPDWGASYIDLNLSEQHMWLIIDGALIFDTDVVTGLPTPKKETPEGVWTILEMMRDKTLRGEQYPDGTYEYETPVDYWMRMTWTGCGFHDATWQPYFGGSRYLSNGSHGCINMSYSDAQELYSLVWVGLPVVCHY